MSQQADIAAVFTPSRLPAPPEAIDAQGWWAGPEAARTPARFRDRVVLQFRSPANYDYLRGLFTERVPAGALRRHALATLHSSMMRFTEGEGRALDLLQSDPIAQRGELRPAVDLWGEVRRLNRVFLEDRLAFLREKAALIDPAAPRDGVVEDDEDYAMRMFISDSLRPPGLEHLNTPGPLYALREDQSTYEARPARPPRPGCRRDLGPPVRGAQPPFDPPERVASEKSQPHRGVSGGRPCLPPAPGPAPKPRPVPPPVGFEAQFLDTPVLQQTPWRFREPLNTGSSRLAAGRQRPAGRQGRPAPAGQQGRRREGFVAFPGADALDAAVAPREADGFADDDSFITCDKEDAPWSRGRPNRTPEQAMAEYWGDDWVASDTLVGGTEQAGQAYGDRYSWGDKWLENGGTRFERYERPPFWQKGGREGIDYDIEETLGTAGRELDAHVRRTDMDRLRKYRSQEYRHFGARSGHVV